MMRGIAFIGLIFFMALSPRPSGSIGKKGVDQPPSAKVVFDELRSEMVRVNSHRTKFVEIELSIGFAFARIPKQIDVLEKANEQMSMPKEYLSALHNQVFLFRKIAVIEPTKKDVTSLQDIYEDLESKGLATDVKIKEGNPYTVKVTV
jgi:hypothetical protein